MKFGENLLGKTGHAALLKLQDNEIKMLEAVKKTLIMRSKCEKECGQSLSQIQFQCGGIDPPNYESKLHQAWQDIVSDIGYTGQVLIKRSENLQLLCKKLGFLIKEKTSIKKAYSKQREKLDNELVKTMYSTLNHKHSCCVKAEDEVSSAHKSYDQIASKKGKTSALEKAQDKYRKTTMKLHNYHNDYVFQVEEAKIYQKQYRSSTLVELLNGLQSLETNFVDAIKDIFSEYLRCTSSSTDDIISKRTLTENQTKKISSKHEYNDFVALHRAALEEEVKIYFVPYAGQDSKFPKGQIVVDSLTIQDLEHLVQDYSDDITVVQEQKLEQLGKIKQLENELREFKDKENNLPLWFGKQQEYVKTKQSFVENENYLERLIHLHRLASTSLQEIEGKDPPPGLFLTPTASSPSQSPTTPDGAYTTSFAFTLKKKLNTFSSPKQTARKKSIAIDSSIPIQEQSFYHGSIQRDEAEKLLRNEGDFLMRQSTRQPYDMVLSSFNAGLPRHFMLAKTPNGTFSLGNAFFPTISTLIEFYYRTKTQLAPQFQGALINPIDKVSVNAVTDVPNQKSKEKWQLSHDDIIIGEELGTGNFGVVYKGTLKATDKSVAVKTCKDSVDAITKNKFLMEAMVLKGYDHPNIVKLIGFCTEKEPLCIVMELISGGDLRSYLRKKEWGLLQKDMIQLCRDACSGLAYLEERKCIHRDIAARNCLITDHNVVKISDFGLSRQEEDGVYTMSGANKKIPLKWTAPEALCFKTFTSASDVWSFGILSWEVFSYGKTPYPGMTNQLVFDQLLAGYRMPQQPNCPDEYYNKVIRPCWSAEAANRPQFKELIGVIKKILKSL